MHVHILLIMYTFSGLCALLYALLSFVLVPFARSCLVMLFFSYQLILLCNEFPRPDPSNMVYFINLYWMNTIFELFYIDMKLDTSGEQKRQILL